MIKERIHFYITLYVELLFTVDTVTGGCGREGGEGGEQCDIEDVCA